ncbi:MAG: helix-turn-helix domain-containing protein [Deltaproteobacteria bacterium]|nr:helix-turn-helix domain-containing protein [Kofleriaceae bacterium]
MKRRNGQHRGETDTARGRRTRLVEVSILALPSVHTSALYGAHDILSSAGIRWDQRDERIRCETRLRVRTVGVTTAAVEGWNGVVVRPSVAIADVATSDIVYVPALGPPDGDVPTTPPVVRRWLADLYERGAVIATACSGSLVLAEAGLLDAEPATTHWAYTQQFAQRFPTTRLCPERALVLAGDEQRIVTAGGGSLWQELLLYLIARFLGRDAAAQAARLYLLDWGREDQSPYALFQERRQHADAAIRKAQRVMLEHAADARVLLRARAQTGLIERTFQRRFRAVTGVSPVRYLQEIRIELAKDAITTQPRSLDDIAWDVGYTDPATFRRLFKRIVGISPSEYRRRTAVVA